MNDTHDAVGTYAVGALQPDAAEAFEAHLVTCRTCREQTVGFREAVSELALLASAPPPPETLRDTVLGTIGHVRQLPGGARSADPSASSPNGSTPVSDLAEVRARRADRRVRVLSLLVAAVSVVALALGGAVYTLSRPTQVVAGPPVADASLLSAPDARVVPAELPDGTRVSFVASKSQNRALFVADRLPDPGPGKTFQLWTVRAGVPAPDGTFGGGTEVAQWFHGSVSGAGALAVTVEPTGGSRTPTTPILATAYL